MKEKGDKKGRKRVWRGKWYGEEKKERNRWEKKVIREKNVRNKEDKRNEKRKRKKIGGERKIKRNWDGEDIGGNRRKRGRNEIRINMINKKRNRKKKWNNEVKGYIKEKWKKK